MWKIDLESILVACVTAELLCPLRVGCGPLWQSAIFRLWQPAMLSSRAEIDQKRTSETAIFIVENYVTFSSLPLHDASIAATYIGWEAARCDLRLRPVGLLSHLLVFEGFTNIELPRRESWGPSSSVNSLAQPHEGLFEIELQSGDTIRIVASHWAFRPESA